MECTVPPTILVNIRTNNVFIFWYKTSLLMCVEVLQWCLEQCELHLHSLCTSLSSEPWQAKCLWLKPLSHSSWCFFIHDGENTSGRHSQSVAGVCHQYQWCLQQFSLTRVWCQAAWGSAVGCTLHTVNTIPQIWQACIYMYSFNGFAYSFPFIYVLQKMYILLLLLFCHILWCIY